MELSDLKVFLAIAEERNISRAAERLGYVQSNVTARIRKLEEELGLPLFYRHPKGVTLTDKGVTFSEYAKNILNLSEEAVQVVKEAEFPSGPLAIGVVDSVTCLDFMDTLAEFQRRYPDVSLSIWSGTSSDLLTKVLDHQLDGAFVIGEFDSPYLVSEQIQREELTLVTPPHMRGFPDLSQTRWAVSPAGCPFRWALEAWLRSEGVAFDNIIEFSSLETLIGCVRSGLAATLLPASVLAVDYSAFGAFPIPEQYRYTQTCLIRRKDRYSSKAFAAFSKLILDSMAV